MTTSLRKTFLRSTRSSAGYKPIEAVLLIVNSVVIGLPTSCDSILPGAGQRFQLRTTAWVT